MGTVLTVIAITLAAASFKLTSETASEYFAMYVVSDDNLGVSDQQPESLAAEAETPTLEAKAAPSEPAPSEPAQPVPVLLAADREQSPATETAATNAPAAAGERVIPASLSTAAPAERPARAAVPRAPASTEIADPLLSLIGDTPYRRPDGTVFMPIAAQRVFKLRTVIGQHVAVPATTEMPGRIVTNPSSAHLIQSAQDGFLELANGVFPHTGQRVRRGDLLAYLRPSLTSVEQADLESRIQELVNNIDLARKRMARLEEVVMIRYRANRIEEIRVEIEGMRRQLAVLRASVDRPIELRAKTDGIVSRVNAAAGQFVDAGHTIFEIVDPTRLWVTASAYEAGVQDRIVSATALTPDGRRLELQFVGGGLALHQQALPIHFEVVGSPRDLTVDTPVTVAVQMEGPATTGLRVPRASVTRTSDGRELIWERRSAESFLAHHVALKPIDADWVLVTSPIAGTMRIVTDGVATLGQVQ
jgi:multidrug efflux pump subunit AcrA (membrane-fusion protein)